MNRLTENTLRGESRRTEEARRESDNLPRPPLGTDHPDAGQPELDVETEPAQEVGGPPAPGVPRSAEDGIKKHGDKHEVDRDAGGDRGADETESDRVNRTDDCARGTP